MEIKKISPQGFCQGVIKAIQTINKLLDDPSIVKPIYMYGSLVHNKHIIETYKDKGIIIVEDIENIHEGTIIITAHGVSDKVKETIKSRNLTLIDTTCKYVNKTHELIREKLISDYEVVFYGKRTHPETKGVLGISNKIHLVENIEDVNQLNIKSQKIIFTTQTTMSYLEVVKIIEAIKTKYPHTSTFEDVCTATKSRQLALINQVKGYDLCIVVGDPKSNNTNKLKEVCDTFTSVKCIMIENINDLQNIDLTNHKKIAITAGASTPPRIVNEVIEGIKNNDFTSKLTIEDFIKF